jgi:hypothetical protein
MRSVSFVLLLVACAGGVDPYGGVAAVAVESISAPDQELALAEDSELPIELFAVATPADAPLTWEVTEGPAHGSLAGEPPSLLYTPDPDFSGSDELKFEVSLDRGHRAEACVSLAVVSIADAPVAEDTALLTADEEPVSGHLDALDLEGATLTWSLLIPPLHGTFELDQSNGTFTWTPETDWNGSDRVGWEATDGAFTTGLHTLELTVVPVDDPPTANPQARVAPEDTPIEGTLSGADRDGDPLAFFVVALPAHGTVWVVPEDGTFEWTPDRNFQGVEAFSFDVSDGHGVSAPAVVTVESTPVDDPPVFDADDMVVSEGGQVAQQLFSYDYEGEAVTFALDTAPAHGTAVVTAQGMATYVPDPEFSGADAFAVAAIANGVRVVEPIGVQVLPTEDLPVALPVASSVEEGGALGGELAGYDPDGDPLTFALATGPAQGVATVSGTSFLYVPPPGFVGADAFTFTASDGFGSSAPAVVSIDVLPAIARDPPTADDAAFALVEGTPFEGELTGTDPAGAELVFRLTSQPAHATAWLVGATLEVVPEAGYVGPDGATFSVTGGTGESDGASITLDIQPL